MVPTCERHLRKHAPVAIVASPIVHCRVRCGGTRSTPHLFLRHRGGTRLSRSWSPAGRAGPRATGCPTKQLRWSLGHISLSRNIRASVCGQIVGEFGVGRAETMVESALPVDYARICNEGGYRFKSGRGLQRSVVRMERKRRRGNGFGPINPGHCLTTKGRAESPKVPAFVGRL